MVKFLNGASKQRDAADCQPPVLTAGILLFCGHTEDTAVDALLCLCYQFHSGILETWGDREGCVSWVLYVVFIMSLFPTVFPHITSQQTQWEALQGPLSSGPEPGVCCCWSLWGAWLCSLQTLCPHDEPWFNFLSCEPLISSCSCWSTWPSCLSSPSVSSGPLHSRVGPETKEISAVFGFIPLVASARPGEERNHFTVMLSLPTDRLKIMTGIWLLQINSYNLYSSLETWVQLSCFLFVFRISKKWQFKKIICMHLKISS